MKGRMADRIVASTFAQTGIDPDKVGEIFEIVYRAAKLLEKLLPEEKPNGLRNFRDETGEGD